MPFSTDLECDQPLSLGVACGFSHFSAGPWQTSHETPFWTDHFAPSTTLAASTIREWQPRHLGLSNTFGMPIAAPIAFDGALYSVVKALECGSDAFQIVYSFSAGEPLAASAPWQSLVLQPAMLAYLNFSCGRGTLGAAAAARPSADRARRPAAVRGASKFFIRGYSSLAGKPIKKPSGICTNSRRTNRYFCCSSRRCSKRCRFFRMDSFSGSSAAALSHASRAGSHSFRLSRALPSAAHPVADPG